MIVYSKKKIERVDIIIKDTKKDKEATKKWLMRNRYVPCGLPNRPVQKMILWHALHPGRWARPCIYLPAVILMAHYHVWGLT